MEESRRGEKQKGVAGWLVGGWPGLASSGLVWSGLAGLAWLAGDERDASRNEKSLPPFDGMHSIIQFTVANDGV